jgi:hypothetical protein
MLELKERTLRFFREMEANIRSKIEKARQIDEENAKRRANSHSEGEDDGGFYYLDERGDSYELSEEKESDATQTRSGVPFASAHSAFTSSQSTNNLEDANRARPTLAARAASGPMDFSGNRESLSSVDYGSFDPKMVGRTRKNSSSGLGAGPPRRIRTISTMDGKLPHWCVLACMRFVYGSVLRRVNVFQKA